MNEDTQKQLEELERRKGIIQREIHEITSQISLIQSNRFFRLQDPSINSMVDSYEAQKRSLIYQIFDIQAKIDELKQKN